MNLGKLKKIGVVFSSLILVLLFSNSVFAKQTNYKNVYLSSKYSDSTGSIEQQSWNNQSKKMQALSDQLWAKETELRALSNNPQVKQKEIQSLTNDISKIKQKINTEQSNIKQKNNYSRGNKNNGNYYNENRQRRGTYKYGHHGYRNKEVKKDYQRYNRRGMMHHGG